jgi:hypothetical protein
MLRLPGPKAKKRNGIQVYGPFGIWNQVLASTTRVKGPQSSTHRHLILYTRYVIEMQLHFAEIIMVINWVPLLWFFMVSTILPLWKY